MEPPLKPDESDCCNSGCHPCILDFYEEQLRKYKLGLLKSSTSKKNCMSNTTYTIFTLIRRQQHGPDAFLLTFKYKPPDDNQLVSDDLGVVWEPGQYFLLKAGNKNEEFTRAYTPIPFDDGKLEFTILVKTYETGKMSRYFKNLKLNDSTVWRGPYGDCTISKKHQHVLFIAQGTGIAPVYSVIDDILKDEECDTFLKLFYCCKNAETIYLREYLLKCQSYWNFTYEVFLGSSETFDEKYNETVHCKKLTEENIMVYLRGKEDVLVVVVGSEAFMKNMKELALQSNLAENNVILF